jgi:flagellar biosynthetic protein FliR
VDFFALLQNQVGFFLLIFVRITGIFIMAPVFGSKDVNTYIKAGLALIITYILFPLAFNSTIAIPEQLLPYLFIVLGEFVVGLIIGFVSSLVFSAIQMSGQLLDMQIGFGVINIIDPQSGGQVPLIGNFKYTLALLIFLATNGHHVLLSALFTSFKLIPVTGVVVHSTLTDFIIKMVSGTFVIALKISMPILITIVITDIALGILARTMPQMNIFVVGVPGKILIGLFVLSLALPFYIIFLEMAFNGMYKDIFQILSLFG